MKLLFVEDDQTIALGLSYSLKEEGFDVTHVSTVKEAKELVRTTNFKLAIIDLGLPDGNGLEVCKAIKEKGNTPMIILSAVDDEVNVVMGLDIGADDYVTKPFRLREFISRIKSVMRRYQPDLEKNYVCGDIELDPARARVTLKGKEVYLSALEYRILLMLFQHQNKVLSREQLLEGIWDIDGQFINDNTLTVYIKRLREKLGENMSNPQIIKTVRGLGYKVGE